MHRPPTQAQFEDLIDSVPNISDSGVSNTEFGYLNGVSSAIQTQIDTKATTAYVNPSTAEVSYYATMVELFDGKNLVFIGNTNPFSQKKKLDFLIGTVPILMQQMKQVFQQAEVGSD